MTFFTGGSSSSSSTTGRVQYAYLSQTSLDALTSGDRKNVINMGVSFVPNTSIINGWATNVNGTDCSLMPV